MKSVQGMHDRWCLPLQGREAKQRSIKEMRSMLFLLLMLSKFFLFLWNGVEGSSEWERVASDVKVEAMCCPIVWKCWKHCIDRFPHPALHCVVILSPHPSTHIPLSASMIQCGPAFQEREEGVERALPIRLRPHKGRNVFWEVGQEEFRITHELTMHAFNSQNHKCTSRLDRWCEKL